jgi:ABC-2 type transport system ATP-binding protein
MPVLELAGLSKDWGTLRAVDAVDLTVAEGAIFGLLGPNGAGKTTTISMIAGITTPSRGRASVAGHDVVRDPFAARRAMGLVPQDLAIYEELSARQNLRFFGALYGLGGRELVGRIDWALDLAGLADRAVEPVKKFSGGMKRRLNLVAGLLHRPRLLILDEPTVGVDPQSRAHVFEAVRRLRDEEKMTVLYTSHYMEEVEALCERVAVMDKGRVVASGAVAELIAAHAGGALEIEVEGDAAAAAATLGATATGQKLHYKGDEPVSRVAALVEGAGARVVAVRRLGADLESVFLALTGRRLRDE